MLAALPPEQRASLEQEHAALREAARTAGLDIPALGGAQAAAQRGAEPAAGAEPAPAEAEAAAEPAAPPPPPPSPWESLADKLGVKARVEEGDSGEFVFRFGAADSETANDPVGNGGSNSSMSVSTGGRSMARPPPPASGPRGGIAATAVQRQSNGASAPTSSSSSGGSKAQPEAAGVSFGGSKAEAAAPAAQPKPAAAAMQSAGGNVAAAAPAASAAAATAAKLAPPSAPAMPPKVAAPAASAAPAAAAAPAPARAAAPAAPAVPPKPVAPPPPPKPAVDPWPARRAAAAKEVEEHSPSAIAKGRESWLYFSVPEKPVAGAPVVIYFNRSQSEPLQHANRLQLHPKYNCWEVAAEEGDRVDMNHEGRINRAEGVDYYRTQLVVPKDAYELNFVFSNGDGLYDNNGTQNYVLPVAGPMTRDLWLDTAPERAEAAWQAKKAEEARLKVEAAAAALRAKEDEDRRKAADAVAEIKAQYENWREGAGTSLEGRWKMVPVKAQAGASVILQYNRLGGPIKGFDIPLEQALTLRVGHNAWKGARDIQLKRVPTVKADEEWWEALVPIPSDAAVLNFVVNYFEHFDNNDRKDFKALVELPPKFKTVEAWADSLYDELLEAITKKRKEEEAAAAELERQRREKRLAAQEKAEAVRRKQMKHVLFTTPEVVEAGEEVTVYYNPNNSALPGRNQIWIKGGWNRWRHPRSFGPLEMTPPKVGDHFQTTITVPKDAYSMDFVFTDAPEYGQYDSNGGLDYHLPIEGSVVEEPPLHVVHIAVEMAPICKVGGLGDVVTALGRAVQEQGHTVEVLLPRYNFFSQSPLLGGTQYETEFDFGGTRVYVSTCMVEGLRCFFIEPRNGMFDGAVYQGYSDGQRFDFFCRAALEFLLRTGRQPDILHCHDWSTADVAKAYWTEYHQYGLWKPKVVFTIHNMDFGQIKLGEAAYYCQKFTTVSPSYAWEIGGHPAIAPNCGKLMGVRNGIDIDIWDPETDKFLPMNYNSENVVEGKAAARAELRKRLNMGSWGDKPMVGVVSRLTKQKGTHLIAHSCYRTIDRNGQFVLLGSAPDPRIQAEFDALANQYGGENTGFCFAFDEPLSHLIYAACDLILVPSMFEPCGLTQMIAMRYGAIPVVRQTGGLKDTGVLTALAAQSRLGTDDGAMDYGLNRALDAYYNDRKWFHGLQKRVMEQDWSWNKPAHDYIQLYYSAME
ncbi:hypothetical protein COHA_010018 [Chlorella ohadii]|uniref:starch synthase n=1 Tax=Chlorella ohadii TaxID=2649997 RepID=A0AAD5H0Y5_9CHLO|nr:hypothetical protein COHA_010018 [Chlorella ohadii]